MKCGDFIKYARYRINIEKQVLGDDAFGGQTAVWQNVNDPAMHYMAWIKPLSTQEQVLNQQLRSKCTHKFIIRYDSKLANTKVTGAYRIVFSGRVYNIEGIKNFDNTMKNYGTIYHEITAIENQAEYDS